MTNQKNKFNNLTEEEKNDVIKNHSGLVSEHIRHYAQYSLRYAKEDILQEGWMYVFNHWNKFNPNKASRSTWIYNTFQQGCKNYVSKEYGKQRRQAVNLVEDGNLDISDISLEDTEANLIKQLPAEYQEIIKDKLDGMSYNELRTKYKLYGGKNHKDLSQIIEEVAEILDVAIIKKRRKNDQSINK